MSCEFEASCVESAKINIRRVDDENMNMEIKMEMIQNGFLVKFYDGDSTSKGSYTIFCNSWRSVNAAIEQWKAKWMKWLDDWTPEVE